MNSSVNISFPDGAVRQYASGITGYEIALSISEGLAKKIIAAKVNGEVVETNRAILTDAQLQLITWDDTDGKSTFWHSSAHILAEAILHFYPNAKLGFGPPIEEGFYYDIDFGDEQFSQPDFEKVEQKFMELAASGETFTRKPISKADALTFFTERKDSYKIELIQGLEDGNITLYESGNFIDLCKGPHIPNSKIIKAVKILNTAGAYWRGDSNNKQLTRIYAISFPNAKDLKEYLHYLEEAKKRDHRKLGRELDMFSFHEEGPGFPFWHNNGMIVLNELQQFLRKKLYSIDYEEIKTPTMLTDNLWRTSGHYENYKENMYFTVIDEQSFAVKPMNCPGSILVYRSQPHSYRDLPRRLFEFGHVHRHEYSGALAGLFRVRAFTQDDAHIYCTPDQVEGEITALINLVFDVYNTFGFKEVDVYVSTRPDNYIGEISIWDKSEAALKDALHKAGIKFTINEGDGAFYGPKIDFVVRDSLRRRWQLGTIQLDFSMPGRFGLEYIDSDNTAKIPVMLHRAVFGSFERFVGVLLEHFAGNLPMWLSPVQGIVLPISEKYNDYAKQVKKSLESAGIRVSTDLRNETIKRKIRDAEVGKIPMMLVVGEKEMESVSVAIRQHKTGDLGVKTLGETMEFFKELIQTSYKPEAE